MAEELPADPTGIRYYGGDATVHGNGEVNVEVDRRGRIVAVWFRCQPLPFTTHAVQDDRAKAMRRMYDHQPPQIDAIVLREQP